MDLGINTKFGQSLTCQRIIFDDMHDDGILSWDYLYDLGEHKLSRMRTYLQALRSKGWSREPKRRVQVRPAPKPAATTTTSSK